MARTWEQRIGILKEEIRGSLQDSVERQLDLRQQDLTGRLVRVGVLAAVGGAALTLALLFALGVISL